MRLTEKFREGVEQVRSHIKEAPRKRFENKMRKLDASAQKFHEKAARLENRNKAVRELQAARNSTKLSKIEIKRDKATNIAENARAKQQIKQAKFNNKIESRKNKYENDITSAKSKVTKQLQAAVIDVIDGKPVNSDMLKYAKGSPAYRAMLKIKQGFTIGKANRELAAIRAEMMSTNPLKREVAIKKFAQHIENTKLKNKEKIKDYAASRERKTKLGEAAIKYGSMLGSATAISGALGSMYGGNDDDEA